MPAWILKILARTDLSAWAALLVCRPLELSLFRWTYLLTVANAAVKLILVLLPFPVMKYLFLILFFLLLHSCYFVIWVTKNAWTKHNHMAISHVLVRRTAFYCKSVLLLCSYTCAYLKRSPTQRCSALVSYLSNCVTQLMCLQCMNKASYRESLFRRPWYDCMNVVFDLCRCNTVHLATRPWKRCFLWPDGPSWLSEVA